MSIKERYKKIKFFLEKYERFMVPGMLVLGVIADFVTFRSIRISTAFIILGIYLVLAGLAIAFINLVDEKVWSQNLIVKYLRLVAPLAVQFTFGALLSASLIFYWFSGALSVSWPFIIIIALLMMSNEVLREYYLSPSVQISVYFFILFSIFSLMFPFFTNSIEVWVFVAGGIASLAAISIYVRLLSRFIIQIKQQRYLMFWMIGIIFALMNGLYFTNSIPPIPLSLREAGAYHQVVRAGDNYVVQAEAESLLQRLWPGQTIHANQGERIYVFSSVFAPADLKTRIYHDWQYRQNGKWVTRSRPSFAVSGGREAGYRGYSYSTNLAPGQWRVQVETERGQVLGRVRFTVESRAEDVNLIELVK
ncbi:DUF2914 domain-containing protein [Patescibacteria group bacterium]|nr:DUF2914 domain-containing protein [Patescibacteria group bacterium]MBU1705176.1 DUF2914 domain-containing protein [Patescibacteria group bacterium]